jgi:hypothetical protein
MAYRKKNEVDMEAKMTWSVLVIYQNAEAREQSVKFCDHLIERFWSRYEFDATWWSFDALEDLRSAREASAKACEADLIVFATQPSREISAVVKQWVESWIGQRGDREGALVGLMDPGVGITGLLADKFVYLRNVAHRAGMDYLTQIPQDISRAIPDSIDSYSERADQVTSVLDEILHHKSPPPYMLG